MTKRKLKIQHELMLFHKRWKNELKRRRKKRKKLIVNKDELYRRKLGRNIQKHKKNIITSDENLSIANNAHSSINFLNKILDSLKSCMPVNIDVSKVNNITVDALLYLLAIIDNMKYRGIPVYIEGNLPQNREANDIFVKSGFLNYVKSKTPTIKNTENCVKIYDGKDASPAIAKKLCLFTIDKLGLTREQTKGLYNIIMEIIINTKQHAYFNNQTNLPKWYAYARYNNNGINFSILDTGNGIPSTVRKHWTEKINELIAKIPLIRTSDCRLLKSVIKGDFRTKTQETYRGKGIPIIVSYSEKNYIQDLTIVSNRGFVKLNNDEKDLLNPLNGTLYSWRISNDN